VLSAHHISCGVDVASSAAVVGADTGPASPAARCLGVCQSATIIVSTWLAFLGGAPVGATLGGSAAHRARTALHSPSRRAPAVQQAPCARTVASVGRGPEVSRKPG